MTRLRPCPELASDEEIAELFALLEDRTDAELAGVGLERRTDPKPQPEEPRQ